MTKEEKLELAKHISFLIENDRVDVKKEICKTSLSQKVSLTFDLEDVIDLEALGEKEIKKCWEEDKY